jgi:hypothetical protein
MGLLHHRSGYEAADSHSGEHLDRPDHGAPVEIGLSEHSVIRHVQPLAIEKHPIVAVDDFPIAIQHGSTIGVGAAGSLSRMQVLEPLVQLRVELGVASGNSLLCAWPLPAPMPKISQLR